MKWKCNTSTQTHANIVTNFHCYVRLTRAICKFWALKEPPERKHYTMEAIACEEHFERSHCKAADGRFIVKLPFKNGLMLGESRNTAQRCLTRREYTIG